MSGNNANDRQVLHVNRNIAGDGKRAPRLRAVKVKKIADYPGVPRAYLETARNYSNPLLVGPPICDELVALIQHTFTEEEADLVQHIKTLTGKTARAVASAARRPVEEVRPILERLSNEKFLLSSFGVGDKKRYGLLPIAPGVFELVLMRTSLDTLTDWHRRFAELFAALYDTGFIADYAQHPTLGTRYVPVEKTIEAHSMAWPSDRMEEVLAKYDLFAVGLCQCRMTEQIVDRGCDKPMDVCVSFGGAAEFLIHHDKMRQVSKKDVLEIKAEAASAGLANFILELEWRGNLSGGSCSCCGCCCGALRTISQFNAPGLIAPPHFMPQADLASCTYCAKCASACQVGAIVADAKAKSWQHLPERCIGCGLCAVACDRQHAIQMEAVEKYRQPPVNLLASLWQNTPNFLRNVWSVWRGRR